jgi:hypothetical protein
MGSPKNRRRKRLGVKDLTASKAAAPVVAEVPVPAPVVAPKAEKKVASVAKEAKKSSITSKKK